MLHLFLKHRKKYKREWFVHFFLGLMALGLAVDTHSRHEEWVIIYLASIAFFMGQALWAFPRLMQKKYSQYFQRSGVLILAFMSFGMFTGGEPKEVIPVIIALLLSSTIYGFIRWRIVGRMTNYAHTANLKTAELQLLKSQINPHFIFNSLNVLYSTALEEDSPQTAGSIAKMSNLIRYLVEDSSQEFISINKEVKYLEDYMKIQLDRQAVEHDIEFETDISSNSLIAPMLLIPFVENAFKHGIDPESESIFHLYLMANEGRIYFHLINSISDTIRISELEKGFGIGIENVQKRLNIIYPKRHQLKIKRERSIFRVELDIKLD